MGGGGQQARTPVDYAAQEKAEDNRKKAAEAKNQLKKDRAKTSTILTGGKGVEEEKTKKAKLGG